MKRSRLRRVLLIAAAGTVALAALVAAYVVIGSAEPPRVVEQRALTDRNMTRLLAGLPDATPDLSAFPVKIENCGRELTFDQPPSHVIGLWQPSNELLLALGVQSRVIGFAGMYDKLPAEFDAAAKNVPALGTILTLNIPNREQMAAAKPDLIVTEGLNTFAFDPAQGFATVSELEQMGAQVFSSGSICDHRNTSAARGVESVYADLRALGALFGISPRAEALIARLRAREQAVMAAVKSRPPVRVAFYNGDTDTVYVLNGAVWSDLMKKAGGQNVFEGVNTSGAMSPETFAAIDADVVLYGIYPQNGVIPGRNADKIEAHLRQTFPNIPAVKTGRLYAIPTITTEASVRVIDGLELIARALHPDAFK
jgi:iron complex transport system substrate-binding protein